MLFRLFSDINGSEGNSETGIPPSQETLKHHLKCVLPICHLENIA